VALERLRQEDHEFEAGLSYVVRPYLKNKIGGWGETQIFNGTEKTIYIG
jgi:hypothetical protein